MTLVTIPKKVAESIERIWDRHRDSRTVMKAMYLTNWKLLSEENPEEYAIVAPYATDNPVKYMTAVAEGYEVEQTPEDRLLIYYNECKRDNAASHGYLLSPWAARMLAMKFTLDTIGKTVPGINDK